MAAMSRPLTLMVHGVEKIIGETGYTERGHGEAVFLVHAGVFSEWFQFVEASLALTLPGGFAVNANGTILDASFDDFAGFEDNTPPGVPEQAANLELSWTGVQGLQLRGDLRYVGRRFSDNANRFRIPAYTVVDLGATYALTDNLALDVRVFNLFDKAYALTTYSDQQRILGRPRSFDVSVRASF